MNNSISGTNKGYSFGKSKKMNLNVNSDKLGPGSYDPTNTTFNSRYGFIPKGKRYLGEKKESTPGYYTIPVTVPNLAMYNYAPHSRRK